ncbi:DUF2905 family protein [Alkaliphilus pronyensis]|uniref:DUF2905 family protein n=1 Tax=Alkaliphilus pronyensis TaxID=1482732 RepID=A0A6I0FDF4_9FIRM|nr:DUF2905 family protein [Alkaliphilus pronyensis]KAB3537267.1 DUF2905 family protein [Alkaliphilus pronyensis]
MGNIGKILVFAGLSLAAIGCLIMLGGRLGLGKLPGDIFIKKGNFTFYFPLVTSIIISIVLSILLNLFLKRR